MLITSKQNEIIKYAVSLKEPKYIRKNDECLVESEKIVAQLLKQNRVKTLFVEASKLDKYKTLTSGFKGKFYSVSTVVANHLSDSVTTSGIFAIIDVPRPKKASDKVLVLDNLQDPSNLGAIVRSAMAFGYESVIMLGGVYPYTPKCIRSSMGYVLDINIIFLNYAELVDFLKENKYNLVCADMSGEDLKDFKTKTPLALVIGNEGNGIGDEVRKLATSVVKIPMQNGIESLNASISASIIMYNLNLGE